MESSKIPLDNNSDSENSVTQFDTHEQLKQYLDDQKAINSEESSGDDQNEENEMYSSNWGTKAKTYYEKDNQTTKKMSRAEQERIEQQTLSEALQKKKTIENMINENAFDDPDMEDSEDEAEEEEKKIDPETQKSSDGNYMKFYQILAENLQVTNSQLEEAENLPDILLEFLDLKKMLTIDFMTAITMYFYLNSCMSESELESHPINSRLQQYEKIFKTYEKSGEDFQILDSMVEQVTSVEEQPEIDEPPSDMETEQQETSPADYELYLAALKEKKKKRAEKKLKQTDSITVEEEKSDDDEKRKITREMDKNKGHIASKKKKIDRNPRVKHREKFRRSKIKRKGQVREVRSKETKYQGEFSGIRTGVTASRKII